MKSHHLGQKSRCQHALTTSPKANSYRKIALPLEFEDIRKRTNARDELITYLTETYACQTCLILTANYFRVFTRLIPPYLIRILYISRCAPLTVQGTCVKSVHTAKDSLKDQISYCSINEPLRYYEPYTIAT